MQLVIIELYICVVNIGLSRDFVIGSIFNYIFIIKVVIVIEIFFVKEIVCIFEFIFLMCFLDVY